MNERTERLIKELEETKIKLSKSKNKKEIIMLKERISFLKERISESKKLVEDAPFKFWMIGALVALGIIVVIGFAFGIGYYT